MPRPEIILIHGAFSRPAHLAAWVARFERDGFRCRTPALPGHEPPDAEALSTLDMPDYLRRLGVAPRKALGQHFLVDEFILNDIADAAALRPEDVVLEIGAGPGGLTEELAKRGATVVAVEIDEELAGGTRARLARYEGLQVLAAEFDDAYALQGTHGLHSCVEEKRSAVGVPSSVRRDDAPPSASPSIGRSPRSSESVLAKPGFAFRVGIARRKVRACFAFRVGRLLELPILDRRCLC